MVVRITSGAIARANCARFSAIHSEILYLAGLTSIPGDAAMRQTTFDIPKMDCPAEERLVRMALQDQAGIHHLEFDLEARRLVVQHVAEDTALLGRLLPLGFGATIRESALFETSAASSVPADVGAEARVLRQLLLINGTMFAIEVVVGLIAKSTGVLADSVDMFADAAVYGLSLYGVGRAAATQHRAARLSGVVQLVLSLAVLAEVARRAVTGGEPMGPLMMGVSVLALIANLSCLALLSRHRTGGVHLQASWIFSTNDVLANIGVIVAGVLVMVTRSHIPDLVIGAAIGLLVLSGAIRILRLARPPPPLDSD